MFAKRAALAAFLALAACDGNPWSPDDDGGTTDKALIPATVTKDVEAAGLATWNAGDAVLRIRMKAQDATALTADYQRAPSLDIGGYQAYTYQSTTSNRMVVALVRGTGTLKAVTAVEGGQFANYHGGGAAYRSDVFVAPTAGVGAPFDYSGSYVGLLNIGTETPGGPGGSLNPTQAYRTTGRALITADFTEMRVSGGVDQRTIVETSEALPDIALWITGITADGTFSDTVYRAGDSGWQTAGQYAGAFGGINASEVAVLLVFNPTSDVKIMEHGVIVLPSCTTGGGPACP